VGAGNSVNGQGKRINLNVIQPQVLTPPIYSHGRRGRKLLPTLNQSTISSGTARSERPCVAPPSADLIITDSLNDANQIARACAAPGLGYGVPALMHHQLHCNTLSSPPMHSRSELDVPYPIGTQRVFKFLCAWEHRMDSGQQQPSAA